MNEKEALKRMVPPGQPRDGKPNHGVIQIHLTRACDKACLNCTQGSNLAGKTEFMPVELFREAAESLKGYFGTIGIFGGNPCLHPKFDDICHELRQLFPKAKCGLWSNNINGWGHVARVTFNPVVSNLNVHLDEKAYSEMRRDWPEARPFGLDRDSGHSPVFGSMIDIDIPEEDRWKAISQCDINQHWSAMIGMFRGELRAWFCEIAGAQSIVSQYREDYPDTGVPVTEDWWKLPMESFTDQVHQHCHNCVVPLRGKEQLSQDAEGYSTYTKHFKEVYRLKRSDQDKVKAKKLHQIEMNSNEKFTHYLQNGKTVAQ